MKIPEMVDEVVVKMPIFEQFVRYVDYLRANVKDPEELKNAIAEVEAVIKTYKTLTGDPRNINGNLGLVKGR